VARLLAAPDSAAYAMLLEAVEEGNPGTAELATALLQVASALVQTAAAQSPQFVVSRPEREVKDRGVVENGTTVPDYKRPAFAAARRTLQEEIDAAVADVKERLGRAAFEAAAPAATRLPTLRQRQQAGQRVRVQEVLDVATLLAEALTVLDLRPLGNVGEVTTYDPRQHVPRYQKDHPLAPGTKVRVDTVGYTCQGRVLRPAQVVRVTSDE
jgi:hypothetical protein